MTQTVSLKKLDKKPILNANMITVAKNSQASHIYPYTWGLTPASNPINASFAIEVSRPKETLSTMKTGTWTSSKFVI